MVEASRIVGDAYPLWDKQAMDEFVGSLELSEDAQDAVDAFSDAFR